MINFHGLRQAPSVINVLRCEICNSDDLAMVNTYKHHWVCCNQCQTATRKHKERYLVSYLPQCLLKAKPGYRVLLPDAVVIENHSKKFDYMATKEHTEAHQNAGVFELFMNDTVRKYGIKIEGKRILDVSGGNGNFSQKLEEQGAKVCMTEYNERAVEFAKNKYKIEAVKFDLNNGCIGSLFKGTFDLVLLRAAIMFCLQPGKFLNDLKKITHKETLVIVYDSVEPTLGAMLRLEFDDYTYLRLYSQKTLIDLFRKEGLQLITEGDLIPYIYTKGHCKLYKMIHWLYEIPATFNYKNRVR